MPGMSRPYLEKSRYTICSLMGCTMTEKQGSVQAQCFDSYSGDENGASGYFVIAQFILDGKRFLKSCDGVFARPAPTCAMQWIL